MKKASVLVGAGVLTFLLLSFTATDRCEKSQEYHNGKQVLADLQKPFEDQMALALNTEIWDLDDIVFAESDEQIDLGFDTAQYLPVDFDAHKGMVLALNEIEFVEIEKEIELGFDTAQHLPAGFNAYAGMHLDLDAAFGALEPEDIRYFMEEEDIDLGFDTRKYLPEGFHPYAKY